MKRTLCAVGLVALGLNWASAADAGTLAPAKPSQVVALGSSGFTACPFSGVMEAIDTQHLPNGTVQPFSIPAGEVLVVTSGDLHSAGAANSAFFLIMTVETPSGFSVAAEGGGTRDAAGDGFFHLDVPSGTIVKSGAILCLDRNSNSGGTDGLLHGFFAKDN